MFNPVPDTPKPSPATFFDIVKRNNPEACIMDVWEPRPQRIHSQPDLNVLKPKDNLNIFLACHECTDMNICDQNCIEKLETCMRYTKNEILDIEIATRGQAENTNWHDMRKGVITASNMHKVDRSTNFTKTAISMLNQIDFTDDSLPHHIAFGRKYETAARKEFLKVHKYIHKGCSVSTARLYFSTEYPLLAASPDGILKCELCSHKTTLIEVKCLAASPDGILKCELCSHKTTLIEVKCLSSKRHFKPGPALMALGICYRDENDELIMNRNHKYFSQIQGQMLVTDIPMCHLVAFTHKGIKVVTVPFDPDFCERLLSNLKRFYLYGFLQLFKAVGHAP